MSFYTRSIVAGQGIAKNVILRWQNRDELFDYASDIIDYKQIPSRATIEELLDFLYDKHIGGFGGQGSVSHYRIPRREALRFAAEGAESWPDDL